MDDKILNTIKKLLGIASDYNVFDIDILISINTAFSILAQLGVNDSTEFIADADSTWDDYIPSGENLEMIKTYIYLKVRTIFDPPTSSFLLESMQKQIDQLEWRINVGVETESI